MQEFFDSGLALLGLVLILAAAASVWIWVKRERR